MGQATRRVALCHCLSLFDCVSPLVPADNRPKDAASFRLTSICFFTESMSRNALRLALWYSKFSRWRKAVVIRDANGSSSCSSLSAGTDWLFDLLHRWSRPSSELYLIRP